MDIKQKVSIHNRFDIEVIDSRTGEVKQKAYAENIVLNRLWTALLADNGNRYFGYIFYGSGTGTPSASDSTLFNHVASVAVKDSEVNGMSGYEYTCDLKNGIASARGMIQLDENTAVGVTITEVGIGYGSSADNLCTHAMLQDMNGNQISIQKTDTDIVNIYATVHAHWTQIGNLYLDASFYYSSTNKSALFKGWVLGTTKTQYSNIPFPKGAYFTKEGSYKYKGYNNVDHNYLDYKTATITFDAPNKKAVFAVPRYTVSEANAGGIGAVWVNTEGYRSIRLSASDFYAGDNIVGEAVGTGDGSTKNFALKFDFPENAKIYVNGTQVMSGFTVRKIPANTLNLKQAYVRRLYSGSTASKDIIDDSAEPNNTGYLNRDKYVMEAGAIIHNMISDIGFASMYPGNNSSGYRTALYGSNDLESWTEIYNGSDNVTEANPRALDATSGHYKYYKALGLDNQAQPIYFTWNTDDFKAVVFASAPANGDVITADYHTPYIAKDADHVLDISYTVQFGEHTE